MLQTIHVRKRGAAWSHGCFNPIQGCTTALWYFCTVQGSSRRRRGANIYSQMLTVLLCFCHVRARVCLQRVRPGELKAVSERA